MATFDPVRSADESFLERVSALSAVSVRPLRAEERVSDRSGLDARSTLSLFDAQATSRHLDFAARELRARNASYYTIGSAGHEGNVVVGALTRPTDPALLHYRSGAFFLARAARVPDVDGVRDVLLGVVAARDEPIAGGRHKVFGSVPLGIVPQTSTIASHLPRAVGLALSLARRKRVKVTSRWADDAIVVCSFGDASANHSTATGAINTACHTAHQALPLPLLFLCEDNGLGISVPTPHGWIAQAYGARPSLKYFHADGGDLLDAHRVAEEAIAFVRTRRRPAFLHLDTVRLLGHAGSDLEIAYRTAAQIESAEARDPLVGTARTLVEHGVATKDQVIARYESIRARVREVALSVERAETLRDAADVMRPLARSRPEAVRAEVARVSRAARVTAAKPMTLAESINATLAEVLEHDPEALVFGEDVGRKGGVYGVTRGLQKRFGVARVFDTLLDEQSILGLGLGAGLAGYLPIPEIQYLAYLHNAIDQLRGEAASQSFFSQGAFENPLVVRLAGLAYQKGFGGHFHNDNAVASLRDIPGLVVAVPSMPDDGARLLRTCVAAAKVDGRVCVVLEPIALYHTRDLHTAGDLGWLAPLPPADDHAPLGRARVHGDGTDLALVTFGNGLPMSLRVAARLADDGAKVRVVDLRWLAPLPVEDIVDNARAAGKVLVVDETRKSGGVSEAVFAALVDAGFGGPLRRVSSLDSFVPLGPAADHVLLGEAQVERAAREMLT